MASLGLNELRSQSPGDTKPLPEPYVDFSLKVFGGIHLRAFSQEVLENLSHDVLGDFTFKITATSPSGHWVNGENLTMRSCTSSEQLDNVRYFRYTKALFLDGKW